MNILTHLAYEALDILDIVVPVMVVVVSVLVIIVTPLVLVTFIKELIEEWKK